MHFSGTLRGPRILVILPHEKGIHVTSKQFLDTKRQHWLFGLAACLWPVAFALVGIFGSAPLKIAGALIRQLR
jgi:hypothetical protein